MSELYLMVTIIVILQKSLWIFIQIPDLKYP